MNINKISTLTKIKTAALGTLVAGSVVMCSHSRKEYINNLKYDVKENVSPQVYQRYEKQAAQIGANETKIFREAYDSIQQARGNYYIGMQNIRNFE